MQDSKSVDGNESSQLNDAKAGASRRPLFSCVLPTKNRAHLLKTCVPCILEQTFSDFELIVVDNDDTPATSEFLATVKDPRLSVIRTGNYDMPKNWQTALRAGSGEYLIVVEDKMHFRRNALEIIANAIHETNGDLITWKFDQILSLDIIGPSFVAKSGTVEVFPTEEVLLSARKGEWRLLGWAGPRGLNSAIRRTTLEKFEADWGFPASRAIAPDYTMAYSMLMTHDSVVHIHSVLAEVIANSQSVGGACLVRGPLMHQFLKELGVKEEESCPLVPVRYLSAVNALYSDLINTAKTLNKSCPVDMASYFKSLAEEVFVGEDMGGDLRENRAHLIKVFREQPSAIQMRALKYIVEQTFIKVRKGYPFKKAIFRSYHQLKNLGFLPF